VTKSTAPLFWIMAFTMLVAGGCDARPMPGSKVLTLALVPPTFTPVPLPLTSIPSPIPTPTRSQEPNLSPTPTMTLLPVPTTTPIPTCGPPPGWVLYTVRPGDALYALARKTGTTVDALVGANCRQPNAALLAGQELYVPRLPPTPTLLPPTPTLAPQSRMYGDFEFTLITHPADSSKTDIYVRNVETGERELFVTLPDVCAKHYHPCEYHDRNLYVIRRIGYDGYPDDTWTDELWRYDADGAGVKLYSTQGLDFRVAPDEKHIAIRRENLIFIDALGNPLQEFTVEQLSSHEDKSREYPSVHAALLKWSDDSTTFWGALQSGPRPTTMYSIRVPSWELKAYDLSEPRIPWEYDLNANTGEIVYSDYPQVYDEFRLEEFQKSQRTVTLSVYDLSSQDVQIIATSVAKEFNPRWVDDEAIEYDHPDGEDRIVYTID
jgi:LysM repeat protein